MWEKKDWTIAAGAISNKIKCNNTNYNKNNQESVCVKIENTKKHTKKYKHKFRNLIDDWHKHIGIVWIKRWDTIDFKVNTFVCVFGFPCSNTHIKSVLLQFEIMWMMFIKPKLSLSLAFLTNYTRWLSTGNPTKKKHTNLHYKRTLIQNRTDRQINCCGGQTQEMTKQII